MPEWFSVLPPLLAIVLALITRQVILSLFAGVWLGAFFLSGYNPVQSFFMVTDRFVKSAVADPDHTAIILFTMMLGGMAGLITRNGGAAGFAKGITRWATSPRRGQWITYLMGVLIFFDDYANTLIVGNTMRPITDRLKISREKLSYLVDATSAPVAVLSISTWVGFELGLIGTALKGTGYSADPFSVFLWSIPFRFYPIFTLILIPLLILLNRDFGGMYQAEVRARMTGKVLRDGAQPASDLTESRDLVATPETPARWYNAVVPVLVVVGMTLFVLYWTGRGGLEGEEATFKNILAHSNSTQALMWSSLSACVVAILLSVVQRILTVHQAMDAWFAGVKSMLLAVVILVLAWSIGGVTKELKTAEFLVGALSDKLPYQILPALVFVVSCLISFATGTSWGTMAVVMPIVIPLVWNLGLVAGLSPAIGETILFASVSSVLAGSVFGDHCSPISDTTVMSSMASSCDHLDHVRTQMPYAVLAAVVGFIAGSIPAGYGLSPFISIGVGCLVLFLFVRFIGKKV